MINDQVKETKLLQAHRVLDLTNGGCLFCGKVFGDYGADVIVVEPPGGSTSRNIGPFYHDIPDLEKSLFWWSYSSNKRGITLNLHTADGRELFKRLIEISSLVIESFPVGYLDKLGLSYSDLNLIHKDIIWTSITAHGQTGPKSWYKGCDLTAVASSGYMWCCGDSDRAPVWISYPQAALNAAVDAFAASVFALWHSVKTGEGQHIDVSMQECSLRLMQNINPLWELNQIIYKRSGNAYPVLTGIKRRLNWKCKDGYVCTFFGGGASEILVRQAREMVRWMDEKGLAPDWLKEFDWINKYGAEQLTQELVNQVEETFAAFFSDMTVEEVFNGAVYRRLPLAPVYTVKEICQESQLKTREFWQQVKHPELDHMVTYTGPPVKISPAPGQIWRRAPLIGEHNMEVYHDLLGLSLKEITMLKQANAI
jgi:benzylsuccinate CoA-transferase BbsE subunit